MRLRTWVLMAWLAFAGPALADTVEFYGYARDLGTGQYLYTEYHRQTFENGRWQFGTVVYYDLEGREIGRKSLDFSSNPYVPIYRLTLSSGYEEGIAEVAASGISMYRRWPDESQPRTARAPMSADLAADAGFHNLIVDRFTEILGGRIVTLRFAAAGGLSAHGLRVRRLDDTLFEDRPAVLLRVEAASFLIRLVAPSLDLVYGFDGQLLEYRGLSNVHDPRTGRPYPNVRISFSSHPPAEALRVPGIAAP